MFFLQHIKSDHNERGARMENDISINNNGTEVFSNRGVENGKAVQVLQRRFNEVKGILECNWILIHEIEQNQGAREADGLSRNVGLIRELNDNTAYVHNLYSELSTAFSRGLAKGSANKRAYVMEYHSDLSTSSSPFYAKGSPTDANAA